MKMILAAVIVLVLAAVAVSVGLAYAQTQGVRDTASQALADCGPGNVARVDADGYVCASAR